MERKEDHETGYMYNYGWLLVLSVMHMTENYYNIVENFLQLKNK